MTNILVQNIETFATVTTFPDMDAFDVWMAVSYTHLRAHET